MFKKIIRFFGYSILIFLIFNRVITFFQNTSDLQPVFDLPNCTEQSIIDSISSDRYHTRVWRSVDTYQGFCQTYRTAHREMLSSGKVRNKITVRGIGYPEYWGNLYGQLVNEDYEKIQFLADSLYNEAIENNLGEYEFASMVVSFIQDIPYSYVKPAECPNTNKPCSGNVRFGIYSPYEFIHTLSGDCDTRAVLLFAMFDYLGYNPMIVISENYLHAMLALNIHASGDYINYNQKKYYFWETTGKDWDIGILPPSYSNVAYWKVALVN